MSKMKISLENSTLSKYFDLRLITIEYGIEYDVPDKIVKGIKDIMKPDKPLIQHDFYTKYNISENYFDAFVIIYLLLKRMYDVHKIFFSDRTEKKAKEGIELQEFFKDIQDKKIEIDSIHFKIKNEKNKVKTLFEIKTDFWKKQVLYFINAGFHPEGIDLVNVEITQSLIKPTRQGPDEIPGKIPIAYLIEKIMNYFDKENIINFPRPSKPKDQKIIIGNLMALAGIRTKSIQPKSNTIDRGVDYFLEQIYN